ncbi:hypothetical protein [Bacteroides sp. 51]|uniref:hypothetical protein n=1 Tax=Bacteroides sp. 51 TaxID=2302938 RepID=UPI0013D58827|nr:hypothetical protein [Bacteroides sp. 51]NDV80770.1 hypothetical protein [Bacteroides sp. 51]
MKKDKPYKVSYDELAERHSIPFGLEEEIRNRINSANRTRSFTKRTLESRSIAMQREYQGILKMEKSVIHIIQTACNEYIKVRAQLSLEWDYNKHMEAQKKLSTLLKKHKLQMSEPFISVITGYQFH